MSTMAPVMPPTVDTTDEVSPKELGYVCNPYRYAGYEYIEEVKLYDLNARYYNPELARFLSQDPYYNLGNRVIGLYEINVPNAWSIIQANNIYVYCGNNPIIYVDPLGFEKIVISGGSDGEEVFKYNFIETAITCIIDWQRNFPDEEIMWIVANWNYSEQDLLNFEEVANSYNVSFMIIDNKQSLFEYINNKNNDRQDDLVSEIAFFAHGTAFDTAAFVNEGHKNDYAIALGLAKKSNNDLNIFGSDISQIDSSAFAENNFTYFGACRTGAVFRGVCFAQSWVEKTGGFACAATTRTDYKEIYPDDRNYFDKILGRLGWGKKASREIAREKYGFSAKGCLNYPKAQSDDDWKWFEPKPSYEQRNVFNGV